jgi:hypothetical protein|tara:strand:- start:935 stop:1207 length:273 start_codon:yes stop_codon:yes gene_type:complete
MKGKSMKYLIMKRIDCGGESSVLSTIKEANTFDDAIRMKVGAEMLEGDDSKNKIEIFINIDDAFKFVSNSNAEVKAEALADHERDAQKGH